MKDGFTFKESELKREDLEALGRKYSPRAPEVFEQKIVERETCENCQGTGEVQTLRGGHTKEFATCSACNGRGITETVVGKSLATGITTREEKKPQ